MVTGGGTGLGKVMALEFGRLGAKVAVVSRDETHRREGLDALEALGVKATDAACDVRDPDAIAAAFDKIENDLGGPVDVLVNNAAAMFPVAASKLSPNGWRVVIDIVLNGTFNCSREFAARLREVDKPGAILNILATQAFTGGPAMSHSAAAKAGVDNMTKSLAVEWGVDGIRVNSLAPGIFAHGDMRSEFTTLAGDAGFEGRTPGVRTGRLQEFGWAATYMCSPYASYLSGHTMVLDAAGMHRKEFTPSRFVPIEEQLSVLPQRTPKPASGK
jgi:NAD(P)-dependent dehydrogenase (short-subunit alcohol dehydrogenase family)